MHRLRANLAFICTGETQAQQTARASVSGQRGELELGQVCFGRTAAAAAAVSVPVKPEQSIKSSFTAEVPDGDRRRSDDVVTRL